MRRQSLPARRRSGARRRHRPARCAGLGGLRRDPPPQGQFPLDPPGGAFSMKLRYSPASPFVRKVLVQAMETGLASKIEQVPTVTSDPASGLVKENPLGKIPSLTLDDGSALYDSPVICEYLDSLHGGAKMFPASGPARWTALRRQATADGILDAAILRRYELLRPENVRWSDWDAGQTAKVKGALAALEAEADTLGSTVDIG